MAGVGGPRTLATIVFTDTVGFSRLAGLDEANALSLLSRDLEAMKVSCAAQDGKVLNQTGDGLLMMFSSAAGGMRCALDIQRQVAERIRTLPSDQVLHHRIGIHVGDVVFEGDNILGDGVNVAARLQSEAKPDAICFSRTVHDLIKNKVPVDAAYLGPRTLKNLPERIMVWQISMPGDSSAASLPSFGDLSSEETGAGGTKGALMLAGSAGLVLILLFLGIRLWPSIRDSTNAPLPPAPGPVGPHFKKPAPKKKTDQPADDLQTQLATLKQGYRFDDMVSLLKSSGEADKADGPAKLQRYQSLSEMWSWLASALSVTTQDAPLEANVDLGNGEVPCKVYAAPEGIAIDPGGGASFRQLQDLPPSSIYNLAAAAAELPGANPASKSWLDLFRDEYSQAPQNP